MSGQLLSSVRNKLIIAFVLVLILWGGAVNISFQYIYEASLRKHDIDQGIMLEMIRSFIVTSSSITIIIIVLALIIALALSNRITLPIKILTQGAQQVTDGNLDVRIEVNSRDELGALAETFNTMIIHRSKSEQALKKSLAEKEVLLKEIHHRVKNNMAIVLSLLSMQARKVVGESNLRAFKDSRNRIMTMALIHEQLYQSKDLSNIRVEDYLRSLLDKLMGSFGVDVGSVKFDLDIQVETLDIDRLIPCGLIVNELVSNSLKYAFHETENGVVYISLLSENDECILAVGDNGSGLPEDFVVSNTDTLGLQIVESLALQLGGSLEVKRGCGSRFATRFKEKGSSS